MAVFRLAARVARGLRGKAGGGVDLDVRFASHTLGSPGPAGCGVVVRDRASAATLQEVSVLLADQSTIDEAEMEAALIGVRAAAKLGATLPVCSLLLEGGSQLIVRQILGEEQVHAPRLANLRALLARELDAAFGGRAEVRHAPSTGDVDAHRLARAALHPHASAVTVTTDDALVARLGAAFAASDALAAASDGRPQQPPGRGAPPVAEGAAAGSRPARAARAKRLNGAGALTPSAVHVMQLDELDRECESRGIPVAGVPSMARRDALLRAIGAPLSRTWIRRMGFDGLRAECLRLNLPAPLNTSRLRARLRDALCKSPQPRDGGGSA